MSSTSESHWLILEAVIMMVLVILNILLNIWEGFQSEVEMRRRVEHVLRQLVYVKDRGVKWTPENFPHLHTPLSASATLQWTLRDGKKVNCPWALLVEGDIILIKPGQICPGKCTSVEDPKVKLKADQILHIQTKLDEEIIPIPSFKAPTRPQIFRLEETPYIRAVVKEVLELPSEEEEDMLEVSPDKMSESNKYERPTSLLHKKRHFFFTNLQLNILTPTLFTLGFIFNLVRFLLDWHVYDNQLDINMFQQNNISRLHAQNKATFSQNNTESHLNPISNENQYSSIHMNKWKEESQYRFAHLLLETASITLPLLSLTFPFCWIIANYSALAQILATFCSMRHVKITEDPFEDTVERPDILSRENTSWSWRNYKAYFISGFLGRGEYLSRTENMVHTLGSLTSLCCTDKKGILSWPNTSAEKVFLLKKDDQNDQKGNIEINKGAYFNPASNEEANVASPEKSALDRSFDDKTIHDNPKSNKDTWNCHSTEASNSAKEGYNTKPPVMSTEILTITHDIHNPFRVDFDDPTWTKFSNHLKPLGLSILLNTCNISTEEKYTDFFNHLVCESTRTVHERGKQQQAQKDKRKANQKEDADIQITGFGTKTNGEETTDLDVVRVASVNGLHCEGAGVAASTTGKRGEAVEMLPIVTRGCLCEIPKKLGLTNRTTKGRFNLSNQIQIFRHVKPNPHDDKFVKNLNLARLKFPFPHMVSVTVQQRTTGGWQLFSQGTPDIILDSCTDAWSGEDLDTLSEETRKKILDFYHRASLSSYCTAFSFRPLTIPPPIRGGKEYLQLPTNSLPFYWQYAEGTECADMDAINTHIPYSEMIKGAIYEEHAENDNDSSFCLEDQPGAVEGAASKKARADAMACLQLECNQTFLGMVQLQYQPVVDVVQLIDFLEKACIRFVHFSRENELRSRVFSEKMGLESGWNCHISLRNANNDPDTVMEKTVSYSNQMLAHGHKKKHKVKRSSRLRPQAAGDGEGNRRPRTTSEAERSDLKKTKIGASLPVLLDRPAWFLDFPKWQELRGRNGDRKESLATSKRPMQELPESLESLLQTPPCDEFQSRDASKASDSEGVPFEYDIANRAQLPFGIENIRPHLETMDNVPLLVSLFTDCTPSTTKEMVLIMQDYGEVVCVMGSSANYQNIKVFLQSNASLAIEPRYPQLCQEVPVFIPPKGGEPSPVAVSQLLNSVASSLSFRMEDEISIFHLILESRHFNNSLWNAMQFWTCAVIFIAVSAIASNFLMLPPLFTPGQTLYLGLVFIPLISMSLLGSKPDPNIMNLSTGKNVVEYFDVATVKYAAWCYGLRFLPTIIVMNLAHLLSVMDIKLTCADTLGDFVTSSAKFGTDVVLGGNVSIATEQAAAIKSFCERPILQQLHIYQHLNMLSGMFYLVCISLSFLFRYHQLWQKNLKDNLLWFKMLVFLAFIQLMYTVGTIFISVDSGNIISTHWNDAIAPVQVWGVWIVCFPIVIAINEFVKRKEIKVETRHQRRQKLDFGTKLGMNSPF